MKFTKLFILLIILILQSCDVGCISADSYGSLKVKRLNIFSDPITANGIRPGLMVKTTRPNLANNDCVINKYWTPLHDNYDKSSQYIVKVISNLITFCQKKDEEEIDNNTIFSLNVLDSDDNKYQNNQRIKVWQDSMDIEPKNATQLGVLPEINCQNQIIKLNDIESVSLGVYNILPGSIIKNLSKVDVPKGCQIDLYYRQNLQGSKITLTGDKESLQNNKLYNLQDYVQNNYLGQCQGRTILKTYARDFYVNGTGNFCIHRSHVSNSWNQYNSNLPRQGHRDIQSKLGSKITEVILPIGCVFSHAVGDGYNCVDYQNSSVGDPLLTDVISRPVVGFNIKKETNSLWAKNVSSAVIRDNPNTKQKFTNIQNMQATYIKNVFDSLPALKFNGVNNFYNFDSAKQLFVGEYIISFVVKVLDVDKPLKGTLLSINNSAFLVNERYFIEDGKLKYQYGKEDSQEIFNKQISGLAVITIHRKNDKIFVKVNESEIQIVNLSNESLNNDVAAVFIGTYLDNIYYPQDFFQGHIGSFNAYKKGDEAFITRLTNNLMIDWNITKCQSDDVRNQLRLKIGNFDNNDTLFDEDNNFIIPEDYKDKTGRMFFRIIDPSVEELEEKTSEDLAKKPSLCTSSTDHYYQDNNGTVNLDIKIKDNDSGFATGLYDGFVKPIEEYLVGKSNTDHLGIENRFFTKVTGEGGLINKILTLALVLLVVFTGIGYLLGFIKYSQWELTIKIIKLAVVIALVSASGWDFFNKYVIDFFRTASLSLAQDIMMMGDVGGDITSNNKEVGLFANLDNIFRLFVSSDVNGKILGLFFFSPTGFLMVGMFYSSFYIFIHIIAKVLISYVSIFIMISFAFIIAPIFIIFILFERTKDYFAKWLDFVLGYAVQFIFLAVVVGVFSWIILSIFLGLLDYTVCWRPIYYCCGGEHNFVLFSWYRPASFDYRRFSESIKAEYAPDILEVALFLLVISFFKEFLSFIMDLATQIAGGVSTSSLVSSINKTLGTDDLYSSTKKRISNAVEFAGKLSGVVMSGVGGLTAVGVAAYKQIQVDKGNDYKAGGKLTSFANFMLSKGEKLQSNDLYKGLEKKVSLYNLLGGKKIDDALFGIKSEEDTNLISDIQSATKKGLLNAVNKGIDKKSRKDYVKESVTNMLKSKGYDNKKIAKIVNSSQLAHDIKYSQLKSKDARSVLKDSYDEAYKKAQKNNASDPHEEAMKAYEATQQNIGQILKLEKNIQDNRGVGYKGFNLRRVASKVAGNSAERRLANMARKSEKLRNKLEKDVKNNRSQGFISSNVNKLARKSLAPFRFISDLRTKSSYEIKGKSTKEEAKKFLSGGNKDKAVNPDAQEENLDQQLEGFFKNKKNKKNKK